MSNNKKQQKMEFTIENKLSKSGKRKMFFPTINGKRLTKTNFSKKWEAETEAKNFIAHYGETKINNFFFN
jgi:hypothetical protein